MRDLERARMHLEAWYKAELAISTGQSYSIGTRSLTRANLTEVVKQIEYWKKEVAKLERNPSGKMRRAKRFIPRDL